MPRARSWTDADLSRQIALATSQRDLAIRLGLSGKSAIPQVIRRATELGLDTSRLCSVQSIRDRSKRVDDETLTALVKTSNSVTEVLRKGGYGPNGGSFSHVSARIRSLGLDTSHFGQHRVTGASNKAKEPDAIFVILPRGSRRAPATQLRRALIAVGEPHLCAECGQGPEWRGKPLTLQVEHINGNYLDCRRFNLCFLCPNCHTQTATYARNRNMYGDGDGLAKSWVFSETGITSG
jgi:hypothetical protein